MMMMTMILMMMILEDMMYDVWCMDHVPYKYNNSLQDLLADAKVLLRPLEEVELFDGPLLHGDH